jgi:glucokinase
MSFPAQHTEVQSTKSRHAIGIDVGGTKIAGGLVQFPEGRVLVHRSEPTRPQRGPEAVLADVEHMARQLRHSLPEGTALDALGVGLCELVDRNGQPASAYCIDWTKLPVRERLSAIAPCVLEADVRAAALGEACYGTGRGCRHFLYVTIGTGISSCLMCEGKPFLGARGATGTMASSPLPISAENEETIMPTLEQLASGPALVERFGRLGGNATSGEDVLAAACAGDTRAVGVVRSGAEALGAAIGWLVNVLDPDAVVIGGGLGLSEGLFRDTLAASAHRHIWSDLHRDLPILPASLGAQAGVIGAAAYALNSSRITQR